MPEGIVKFSDFQKLDLVVADILSAERVEGSDKLLKLELGVGAKKIVSVAGIGASYSPEDLKDTQVICVANLPSRVVMDVESQTMILAVVNGDDVIVVRPERKVPSGLKVS